MKIWLLSTIVLLASSGFAEDKTLKNDINRFAGEFTINEAKSSDYCGAPLKVSLFTKDPNKPVLHLDGALSFDDSSDSTNPFNGGIYFDLYDNEDTEVLSKVVHTFTTTVDFDNVVVTQDYKLTDKASGVIYLHYVETWTVTDKYGIYEYNHISSKKGYKGLSWGEDMKCVYNKTPAKTLPSDEKVK